MVFFGFVKAAEFFDLNTSFNRVISNKLGYQMYELARTASGFSPSVSAAMYHSETIVPAGFTPSGATYYVDINHNFENYYPLVNLIKISNNHRNNFQITPTVVKSISPSTTRIWVNDNTKMEVIIIG